VGGGMRGEDSIKEKTPRFNQGFFRELEFKVFAWTVKNELKRFFRIFGCFSDIGYVKTKSSIHSGIARKPLILYRRSTIYQMSGL
jgi:hypothetical protein